MILARHAEALFWAGRLIERAESTARIVDVAARNQMHVSGAAVESEWRFLVTMKGLDEYVDETADQAGQEETMRFLFADAANPGSVITSVAGLRENVRVIRDRVPVELWEEANRLYLRLSIELDGRPLAGEPSELFATVRRGCQAMSGLISESMARDEGFTFMVVGRMLERSTMTVRMLRHIWAAPEPPLDAATILRMTSSLQAFRRLFGYEEDLRTMTGFLLATEEVPRSVLPCLKRMESQLDGRLDSTVGLAASRRLCGRVRSELEFGGVDALLDEDPVACLDHLLGDLTHLGDVIAHESFDPAHSDHLNAQFVRPGSEGR